MTCDEETVAFGRKWCRCPWREVVEDREIGAVMRVRSASQLSPLHAWPDSYVAWVQQLWASLDSAKADRERQEWRDRSAQAGA